MKVNLLWHRIIKLSCFGFSMFAVNMFMKHWQVRTMFEKHINKLCLAVTPYAIH